MRAECGCLIEDGMVLHNYDGLYALAQRDELPDWNAHCAGTGHPYYGDDAERGLSWGRCYCGARQDYPAGGPPEDGER